MPSYSVINHASALVPNLRTESVSAQTCMRGIMSLRGVPLAQSAHLRTNSVLAGSGKGPALEEKFWLICGMTSKFCTYVRKMPQMGFWESIFRGTTCIIRLSWATQWPFIWNKLTLLYWVSEENFTHCQNHSMANALNCQYWQSHYHSTPVTNHNRVGMHWCAGKAWLCLCCGMTLFAYAC